MAIVLLVKGDGSTLSTRRAQELRFHLLVSAFTKTRPEATEDAGKRDVKDLGKLNGKRLGISYRLYLPQLDIRRC